MVAVTDQLAADEESREDLAPTLRIGSKVVVPSHGAAS